MKHAGTDRTRQPYGDLSVVAITMRMGGHAQVSGYDRLTDYLPCDVVTPPATWSFGERLAARALRPMIRSAGSQWYHRDSLISELRAARRWLRGRADVFHFLYGENSYRYLGWMKRIARARPMVATYHLPAEKFHRIVTDKAAIRRLDAAIVVSTVQRDIFSGLLDPDRVHYIPHGVDIGYFRPAATIERNNRFRCLFVGSHLRDFDVLAAAAKQVSDKDIEFVVVTSRAEHARFARLGNVTPMAGVNDRDLLALYQSCDLFVMPVLDVTANNALLEAMACGAPVVATDLPGIRDYVCGDGAILTPGGDASALAEAIDYLHRHDDTRTAMARANRERALGFDWERVAAQVMALYRELM